MQRSSLHRAGVDLLLVSTPQVMQIAMSFSDWFAQCSLGACYTRGRGVAQDSSEAFRWYLLAAEGGHAGAQGHVGHCYESGTGVARIGTDSARWLKAAAAQGDADAAAALRRLKAGAH
jgi:uncharacterized protein